MSLSAMDRKTALQALALCDQCERALKDGDADSLKQLRNWVLEYFRNADDTALLVAVECIEALCASFRHRINEGDVAEVKQEGITYFEQARVQEILQALTALKTRAEQVLQDESE